MAEIEPPEGTEPCGVCGYLIEMENDSDFVTTAVGVVTHSRHLPPVDEGAVLSVVPGDTQITSTQKDSA